MKRLVAALTFYCITCELMNVSIVYEWIQNKNKWMLIWIIEESVEGMDRWIVMSEWLNESTNEWLKNE